MWKLVDLMIDTSCRQSERTTPTIHGVPIFFTRAGAMISALVFLGLMIAGPILIVNGHATDAAKGWAVALVIVVCVLGEAFCARVTVRAFRGDFGRLLED